MKEEGGGFPLIQKAYHIVDVKTLLQDFESTQSEQNPDEKLVAHDLRALWLKNKSTMISLTGGVPYKSITTVCQQIPIAVILHPKTLSKLLKNTISRKDFPRISRKEASFTAQNAPLWSQVTQSIMVASPWSSVVPNNWKRTQSSISRFSLCKKYEFFVEKGLLTHSGSPFSVELSHRVCVYRRARKWIKTNKTEENSGWKR